VLILDKPPETMAPRRSIPVTMVIANSNVLSPDALFILTTVMINKTAAARAISLWTFNKALLYGFPAPLNTKPVTNIATKNSTAPKILKFVMLISPPLSSESCAYLLGKYNISPVFIMSTN
jgi:hypothetical protein